MLIWVISDTHGLLRPEALEALKGSELILHAGDVGDPSILTALEELAPVVAVRGNMDGGELGRSLEGTQGVEVEGYFIYLLHDVDTLDLNPGAAGCAAVVFGHSHRPEIREEEGVIFFNPGAAGHRRFDLPISVGRIQVTSSGLVPEIIELEI